MPAPLKLVLNGLAVALVAALVAVFAWQQAHRTAHALPPGKVNVPAPDFTLERLGGGKLSLRSLRGRPVIVNFWATWCEPCKRESRELEATYRKYAGDGLVVVGVNSGDLTGDMRAFAQRYDLTYPIVRKGEPVEADFGVTGLPESFFVDRRGVIVAHVPGGINADDTLHQEFEQGLRKLVGRA